MKRFGFTLEDARGEMLALLNDFRPEAEVRGLAYGLFWVERALDQADKRDRQPGNKPVSSVGYLANAMRGFLRRGSPPPAERKAEPPARPAKRAETQGRPAREGWMRDMNRAIEARDQAAIDALNAEVEGS